MGVTESHTTIAAGILPVLFIGPPIKVCQVIVRFHIIPVEGVQTGRALTNEGAEDYVLD